MKKPVDRMIADEKKGIKEYSTIVKQEKKHLKELKEIKRRQGKRP